MSKEYAVYNWLTGTVFPGGDVLSRAEEIRVARLEADQFAGLYGSNLEVVTLHEAERLHRAFTVGRKQGREQAVGWAFDGTH